MKRILYLHGLESKQGGAKVDFLASQGFVYAPAMDYRAEGCFEALYERVKTEEWDYILGSSMGGYFGFELSKRLNVKAVHLFNPALGMRSLSVVIPPVELPRPQTTTYNLYLGKADEVVNPAVTEAFLQEKGIAYKADYFDYGHRTPIETIVAIFEE
jgi:pimeloyl-ACP methyl ester carboxylesterase